MRIVVLGASGFTGRLVCAELARRGVGLVPAGRSPARLAPLANLPGAAPARVADAKDPRSLRDALEGADALVNLAGPFTEAGDGPVAACVEAGIPYLDSTGEQAFLVAVRSRWDARARAAGAPLASAFAYEYALGDAAARLALAAAPEASRLDVLYRARGGAASEGTKRSVLRVLLGPGTARVGGRDVAERPGASVRDFATSSGPRTALSFPGGEALHVPRWSAVPTIRTYAPARRARLARAVVPLARVVRRPLLLLGEALVRRGHEDPTEAERAATAYEIVAEASGPRSRAVASVTGSDPYGATARLLAEGALALAAKRGHAGFLAPTEVLAAERIVEVAGADVRVT